MDDVFSGDLSGRLPDCRGEKVLGYHPEKACREESLDASDARVAQVW